MIAVSAAIAVPALVSSRLARTEITQRLGAWSGGTVTLGGAPAVAVLPVPTVRVKGVTVRAGDPGSKAALVTIPTLEASLRILPLLAGRVEIGAITLVGPRVRLVRDEAGNANWPSWQGRAASVLGRLRTGGAKLPAGELSVRGGAVSYEDRRSGRALGLTAANLRLTWEQGAKAARAAGSFEWRGARVDVDTAVDDPAAVLLGEESTAHLWLSATKSEAVGHGTGQKAGPRLAAGEDATQELAGRLAAWLPPGSSFGPLQVDGRLSLDDTVFTVSDAAIDIDGNTAAGTVSFGDRAGQPALRGVLRFDGLSLAPYLQAFLSANLARLLALPLPVDRLDRADLDLELSSPAVDLGLLRLTDTSARLAVRDGRMTFAVDQAGLAGGRAAGRLTLASAGDHAVVRLAGRVEEISVGEAGDAIRAYRPTPLVPTDAPPRGTAAASVELAGQGDTVADVIHSLSGQAVAEVRHGSLEGADIVATLKRLVDGNKVIAKGRAPFIPVAGRTHFTRLTARLAAGGGVVRAQRVRIAGDRFDITLSGKGDLGKGEIVAAGMAILLDSEPGDGAARPRPLVELPFGVGGTLREPVFAPGIPRVRHHARQARASLNAGDRFVIGGEAVQ